MRIVLFTGFTPTKDNYRGPSAMNYHFFKHRPQGCDVRVYTTNANRVPVEMIAQTRKDLDIEVVVLKDTLYNYFHRRETAEEIRIKLGIDKSYNISNYKLSSSILKEIECYRPDFIWVYGEAFTTVIKQLSKFKLLVAGFDCFALHCNRLMRDPYTYEEPTRYKKALYEYNKVLVRELALKDVDCTYFDVGIADRNMFEIVTGRKDSKFYPHPHYTVFPKAIGFTGVKLSIFISGKLDMYTWTDAHRLLKTLVEHCDLANKYRFTILGKGWEDYCKILTNAGFEVENKTWVDIYADECVKHDIQIFPISVGSGTKGKVLDALSMGLLSIGSEIAMENIYVKNGHSCFQYDQVEDVPSLLNLIYENRDFAREIAENGRKQVLKWHNPKRIIDIIIRDMLDGVHYNGVSEFNEVIASI